MLFVIKFKFLCQVNTIWCLSNVTKMSCSTEHKLMCEQYKCSREHIQSVLVRQLYAKHVP